MNYLYGVVLALVASAVSGEDCGPEFRGRCNCGMREYNSKTSYVVNCTDQGFRDTDVLEHLPLQAEVLIFTGNYIDELPWHVVVRLSANLPNVIVAHVHDGEIR